MTAYRGHEIISILGNWVYADTLDPVLRNPRPCGRCENEYTDEGHDHCIGTLPGIMNACCGHGDALDAYVQIDRKNTVRGREAIVLIARLKDKKEESTDETKDT